MHPILMQGSALRLEVYLDVSDQKLSIPMLRRTIACSSQSLFLGFQLLILICSLSQEVRTLYLLCRADISHSVDADFDFKQH